MTFSTLISASDLKQHLTDSNLILIDARHDLLNPDAGRAAFDAGHIPGAQFANLDTTLSDKSPGPNGEFRGRHPLPSREAFIETLRDLGVNDDSQIVAYDAQGGMFAARVWWMLRWVGHAAVAVLDGGVPAWTAIGGELSTEASTKPRGTIGLKPSLVTMVNVSEVVSNLVSHERLVIDARAADRFRGENETIDPVGGHIPGAKNRFFKDNLQADGRFKPAAQLMTEWRELIDTPEKTIMQCGSGATACHNLLALEITGLSGATLYPGSWSEWCADPARPIATGNEPA